ncbi:MAG: DUF1244 domain-containing protein [Xanthomonadales bacterium]|nr:DUF1244 domain-containing protein [Xanthomonadales bacterium]
MPETPSTTEIEAAVFRRLVKHLQNRTDVQNIDLMLLADFCRNCLGKWYHQAALEAGMDVSLADAQQRIYGMPYAEWKSRYQLPADPEKIARFEAQRQARGDGE